MKIHEIDNSLKNLGKTVLWQYDKAVRLLALLKHIQVTYHCAVEQFWDYWRSRVLAIDTCGAFGCSVWGIFLGVPRPTVFDPTSGTERLIATSVYRRILKGAFYLMKASSSFEDILGYLEIVFGVGGNDSLSKWSCEVSEPGWSTNVNDLNKDDYEPDGTILLELIDPEGIVRKIGGAPVDALEVSVSYEFGDTTITARIFRRRKCGITLVDNGDMSMTYGKSDFFEEMHRDQRLLFEQHLEEFCPYPLGIKTNEPVPTCVLGFDEDPKPSDYTYYQPNVKYSKGQIVLVDYFAGYTVQYLMPTTYGIYLVLEDIPKSLNPSIQVFRNLVGWKLEDLGIVSPGNGPLLYKVGQEYPQNTIFGFRDETKGWEGTTYQATEFISASENTSLEAIASKIKKINAIDPFSCPPACDDLPYVDLRRLQYPFRYESHHQKWTTTTIGDVVYLYRIQKGEQFVGLVNGMAQVFRSDYKEIHIVSTFGKTLESVADFDPDKTYWQIISGNLYIFVKWNDSMESVVSALGDLAKNNGFLSTTASGAVAFDGYNKFYKTGVAVSRNGVKVSMIQDKAGQVAASTGWWDKWSYRTYTPNLLVE